MMQQTAVPPQLQALMTLAQGAQQGAVAPMTPDGQPTIAGQMLQQAMPQPRGMPPGMPQMRQNAGIAGQIQAMQMQEAQKALMGQAEAQQRAQQQAPVLGGGIAAAPGAQGLRMAEGGIVGYADGGQPQFNIVGDPASAIAQLIQFMRENPNMPDAEKQAIGEQINELSGRAQRNVPPPVPQQPAPQINTAAADRMIEQGLGTLRGMETVPPSPAQAATEAGIGATARKGFLQSQGLDPEYLAREIEKREALTQEEVALQQRRAKEIRERAEKQWLQNFMMGGGRTFADTMRSSVLSAREGEEAARKQIQTAEDAAVAAKRASAQEQLLLQQARHQIAMGDFNGAQASLAKAQEMRNKQAELVGKTQVEAGTALRDQEVRRGIAQLGAAARESGAGNKDVNMALTRLQSNPDYKKAAEEIARYEAYPESIRNTPSTKARLDELYAKQKALESAMEGAFDLQPGTIALALRNMRGAGAGAGATGTPDTAKRTLKYNPATGKIE